MAFTYYKLEDGLYNISDGLDTFKTKISDDKIEEYIYSLNSDLFKKLYTGKIKALHTSYDKFFTDYKNSYPEGEQSSFDDKRKEALAWKIDSNANTPVCDAIAAGRGEDREEFLQSVYDAVMYLTYQEGVMIKARDEIKSCTTEDELNAVEIPKFPAS